MDLDCYFKRIGFTGRPEVSLETLQQIHRLHLRTIPYENLDVQLGIPLDTDVARIYRKIVEHGRGGWCYELNGLLGWALEEIGFEVMRIVGAVMRIERGEDAIGNHLVLVVELDEPWVADVGLGDGALQAYPLRTHAFSENGFDYQLEEVAGYWRFHNHKTSNASSMDFRYRPADEALLSHMQSTSPDSSFVKNLVCQRATAWGYDIQVGLIARRLTPDGVSERVIESPDALLDSLNRRFGLDVPDIARSWDTLEAAHRRFVAART
jgi:arylamine N-acetyltransferase